MLSAWIVLIYCPSHYYRQFRGESGEELLSLASQGLNVSDLQRQGRVVVEEATRKRLSLIFEYFGKAFWAILRADLNNDGIEDMLVSM